MSKNLFNSVKMTKPNRSMFDLSHDLKFSANMGDLIPTMVMDVIPGDKVTISAEMLVRLAPMVAPMMHRCNVTQHYFFVPNRILWPKWEDFVTNTKDSITGLLPAVPTVEADEASYSKLADYLGIPTPTPAGVTELVSAFPFAAYQCIYNEYYRDENLVDPVLFKLENGLQATDPTTELMTLRKRAWEHDYFTAALPFAQKGDGVSIPLGTIALSEVPGEQLWKKADDFTQAAAGPLDLSVLGPSTVGRDQDGDTVNMDPNGTLEVEPTTINDLRRAFSLQKWLEKLARGGSRYIEQILVMFGVRSSDARLNRPEYFNGTKAPITISEVLNTTGTDDAPQGQMAGHGISVTNSRRGGYRVEEHGYIMCITSIMPKTAYQQGIERHWLRTQPTDYFWPDFANIGEQAVFLRELWSYTNNGSDTFGYVPRYAEYKFMNSRVAGEFRDTLDFWHMGRKFDTAPALNEAFISADPTHRVFAVTDPLDDKLFCHCFNKVHASRLMPKYGTPTF